MRELLVRVTIKDCDVQTFPAGGPGGQNQNKRDTAVRITHRASGAVGEARDQRYQWQNKKSAFRRMADSPKFRAWLKSLMPEHQIEQSSQRIRTYNLIDRFVKDHRSGKISRNPESILDGDLDELRP